MNDSNEALIKRIDKWLAIARPGWELMLDYDDIQLVRAALTASSERLTSEQRLALAKGSDADKVRLWQEYYRRLAARFEALDTASSEPVAHCAHKWEARWMQSMERGEQRWAECVYCGAKANPAEYQPAAPDKLEAAIQWANDRADYMTLSSGAPMGEAVHLRTLIAALRQPPVAWMYEYHGKIILEQHKTGHGTGWTETPLVPIK